MEVDRRGTRRWKLDGVLHREDGPAVERADGTKFWCRNGDTHRLDGPAVEYSSGSRGWYVDGTKYDVYGWAEAALEYQNLPSDEAAVKQYVRKILTNITDEEI